MTGRHDEGLEPRDALLLRYEALRAQAVAALVQPSRERELLMGSGLGAWMRAWSSLAAPVVLPQTEPIQGAQAPACPDVVPVLVEMAMAAAKEVRG